MAWTQDAFLKNQEAQYNPSLISERDRKIQALKQARDAQLSDLNQTRDTTLPTFLQEQNAADARAAQSIQGLRQNMAANGLYRSGSMLSDTATLQNQANTAINDWGKKRTDFLTNIGNQINRANQNYNDESSLANQDYASKVQAAQARAMQDWNVIDAQQRAEAEARAARAAAAQAARSYHSSGGGGSKHTALTYQEKYDNTTQAQQDVNNALQQGISHGDIQRSIEAQRDTLSKQGVNVDALINFLYTNSIAPLETTPQEL